MSDSLHPDTICAHPAEADPSTSHPLAPPIQLSAVYCFDGLEHVDAIYERQAGGFIYARDGHPNAAQLAGKVAALEAAEAALVCASGMAAEAALFLTELQSGDHVALSDGLYGRTSTLVTKELARFGVRCSLFDPTRVESLRDALEDSTRLIFVETLSNPLVRLADLEGIARLAREAGVRVCVDNTFAPLICQPIHLGADAVTHSATKLIGGHSDLTLGLLCGSRVLIDRASSVGSTFGLTGNPFESWLALRGLATLGLRSRRGCENALELAQRLNRHRGVHAVHYPGLPSHPDHDRASRTLQGGFGTMATIDLGDRSRAESFIKALRRIPFAPSLGDVSTTLSHPATTSHRNQPPEQWARQGIRPGLVRLSIGIEAVEDLWDDLRQALDRLD
jgi:cystathionine beta-lyase/cystathionine gamma-synthase